MKDYEHGCGFISRNEAEVEKWKKEEKKHVLIEHLRKSIAALSCDGNEEDLREWNELWMPDHSCSCSIAAG